MDGRTKITREDKQLLLQDLCARLPYGVKVSLNGVKEPWTLKGMFEGEHTGMMLILEPLFPSKDVSPQTSNWQLSQCKPYLRPMSNMTEEESAELSNIISEWFDKELFSLTEEPFLEYALSRINYTISPLLFDWLNAHHFDFRNLLAKGLAIEVTEDNNPYIID